MDSPPTTADALRRAASVGPAVASGAATDVMRGFGRKRRATTFEELGKPSFLRSTKRGEQLRDSKRPRIRTVGARHRMRTKFLDEVPDSIRSMKRDNPITVDVAQMRHSLVRRERERVEAAAAAEAPPAGPVAAVEAAETQSYGEEPEEEEEDPGDAAAKPWLESCREVDEMRGRVPPENPLSLATDPFGTDPRGPDPADLRADLEPPPMDRVVCRIQNWVVRLECVLDRLSARRAVRQARDDLLERRSLRRWATSRGLWDGSSAAPPDTKTYDRWYVERLAERHNGKASLLGWDDPPRSGGLERPGVPIWARSVPRASDLCRRAEAGPDPAQWCECPDLVRRPALDLYSLVWKLLPQGARYDVNNFAALKRSTVNPKAACLVYASARAQAGSDASARIVCTGAKTPEEVAWTLHKLEESIWRAGSLPLRVERSSFRVSNVVASALLPYYVDMDKLARQCRVYCTYTPEAFPGATLRLRQLGKVAVLVYPTKLIIAGSKTKSVLARALRMAVRVTWRARYTDLRSEGARAMMRSHERVLVELLDDATRSGPGGGKDPYSPWSAAIRAASSSSARR